MPTRFRVRSSPLFAGCLLVLALFFSCRRAIDPKNASVQKDSIYSTLHRATHYLDSARNLLVARDPGGDSEHVASTVLLHTPLGDSLRSAVLALVDLCHREWPNSATISNIDDAFRFTNQLTATDDWNQIYFSGTPTMNAYTLLSSMEDECKNAANFEISAIDSRRR
jgi:hypothetical protein